MDRRSFLKASALGGGAAAVSSLAAPAIAGGHARTLTMVTSWPRGFAVLDDAATYFNEAVNAMSGGELVIEKKAPGELVGAFEVFDAVTSGQADMYHSADYYFLGQHPGYAFYTAVPFGATAQELTNWYYHDGGQDLHDELGSIFGLKSFLCRQLRLTVRRLVPQGNQFCARLGRIAVPYAGPWWSGSRETGRFGAKHPRRRALPSAVLWRFGWT